MVSTPSRAVDVVVDEILCCYPAVQSSVVVVVVSTPSRAVDVVVDEILCCYPAVQSLVFPLLVIFNY